MNNDIKNISKLECQIYELEVNGNSYTLELDNNAIKYADRINFFNRIDEMGTQELAENLIEIFAKKHQPHMNSNLAKTIVNNLIDSDYDLIALLTELTSEIALRYEQVFTSKGKKSAFKKI